MMAIAHSPKFSAQAGVPMGVGQKFLNKDREACYPMKDKSKCTGAGAEKPEEYNHPKSRQRRKRIGKDDLLFVLKANPRNWKRDSSALPGNVERP
jgi:hypothetical protein